MIGFKLLQQKVLLASFTNQIKYNYKKDKISLFKAHQNKQIQDRDLEDQQIKLNNNISKINPHSNSITQSEIANFDLYYGRFETVICQGQGLNRKLIKSLKKYDVDIILRQKLKEDYETIVNFIRERNTKMKSCEYIYIFQYFNKNKDKFLQFLQDHMVLFDIIIKGLSAVNIYSASEFVKLQKLIYTFDIKDENIWKNLLIKGNLLFSSNSELENVYDSLLQVFKLFLSFEYKDLNSQGQLIQIKKKLLKGLSEMDLPDCIELFSLIADKTIFIDPVQIRLFEERFISNKESLYLDQFATIFDSMGKLTYQPQELAEYFYRFRLSKINTIIPAIEKSVENDTQTIIVHTNDNRQQQLEEDFDNISKSNDFNKYENNLEIHFDIFTQLLRGISQINYFTAHTELWEQLESMLENYIQKYGKQEQLDKIITINQFRIIIGSFEKTQLGTIKIWQMLSNKREFNLSYEENYIILKNLSRFNQFDFKQLNLTLSYILDEKTDMPRFELILQKESAQKILEKIQVYALVIYKYIEDAGAVGSALKNELEFQKECMKLLLKESVNSLIKSQEKKWKNLTENEMIKLYGLLHLCEYKSKYEITQEIIPLERKISKERRTFSVQQVAFLTLMQECFGSEEQFSKWNNFIFKCIENASQIEFSTYFATFYLHGLTDPYLWSLLLVKYIQHIELYQMEDLLTFMLVFSRKQDIDEEIWDLFKEVVRIKSIKQHLSSLKLFANEIKDQNFKQDILNIIIDLEKPENKDSDDRYIEELNYLEQLNLPLTKVINNNEPLSVYKASSIKHVINLIN